MGKARLKDTFSEELGAAMETPAEETTDPMAEELARRLAEAAGGQRETSGRLMVYMPPSVYGDFKRWCAARGLSMNKAALVAIETMMKHS